MIAPRGASQASRRGARILAWGVASLLAAGIGAPERARAAPAEPIDLADSLEPLREAFDAARGRPRLLAILSPT